MENHKTESQQDKLNRLYTEYGLLKEDIHKHQHYTIIRRTGIEKVAAKAGIRLTYKLVKVQPDFAVVKATGKMGKGQSCITAETYGSAGKDTSQNKYYVEMAEKRAKSRCVLQLTDFYAMGVYGEDEADDFHQSKNPEPQAPEVKPAPVVAAPVVAPAQPTLAPVERPAETQIQKLAQLIASPLLDAEERSMLLSKPLDQRPAEWIEKSLVKLPDLIALRQDPKKDLEAARAQLRTAATKHQKDMPDEAYKAIMLRASALTAKPAELRSEARALLAQFQPQALAA